ncbi:MAG: MFS transporter, partial [Paracoccaceae bacterium]
MTIRLTHCLDRALIPLPEDGLLVAIGPEAPPPLPQDRTLILHPDICQVTALQAQGWTCDVHWPDAPHAAIVTVPRARARAQGWIAAAAQAVGPKGLVVVDGAKTDGIDPLLKAIKARQPL